MAETTRYLGLPLIAAAQAQKHVTHNEALTALDALVQLSCLDKDLTAPPASPAEGDRYLVAAPSPTGAWAGLSQQIVWRQDGVWVGAIPSPGWLAYVIDESDLYTFTGTVWISFRASLTVLQNLARLGIGTSADATNRLAVKSEAALFSWDDATPGPGNMRLTLNKKLAGNDAGLVFQTAYATRALLGTFGSDGFGLKVSADGTTFVQALVARADNGWLTVNGSSAALAPLHIVNQATGALSNTALHFEHYGGDAAGATQPVVVFKASVARGIGGAPLPIKQNDRFFGFFGSGWHSGGGYSGNAIAFNGGAEEDFTASAWGTYLDVQTTPLGGTARRSVAKFRANGALELQSQASPPTQGLAPGQIVFDSTAGAFKGYHGAGWVRLTNLAKAIAYASADTYAAANTWTKVAFNNADSNDQGAFVAATSRFVAPEAGLYAVSTALVFRKNGANNPSAMEIQFYKNGVAAGRGRAAATGTLVDGVTALDLFAMLKLVAGDYVEVFVRFTTTDGYAAAVDSVFSGQQMA